MTTNMWKVVTLIDGILFFMSFIFGPIGVGIWLIGHVVYGVCWHCRSDKSWKGWGNGGKLKW